MHSRKSLLLSKDSTWVKKANPSFDVTMGSYDEAEVCKDMMSIRISAMSHEESEFNKINPEYDAALKKSRFKQGIQIQFSRNPKQINRRRQKRVIW